MVLAESPVGQDFQDKTFTSISAKRLTQLQALYNEHTKRVPGAHLLITNLSNGTKDKSAWSLKRVRPGPADGPAGNGRCLGECKVIIGNELLDNIEIAPKPLTEVNLGAYSYNQMGPYFGSSITSL